MSDSQADLRMLYQAYSSQIEFSKTQLWRVVNYGIWAIAGIIGLTKGFINAGYDYRDKWLTLFPVMLIFVLFICLYNMFKNWRSMINSRSEYDSIGGQLTVTFRSNIVSRRQTHRPPFPYMHPFPYNYKSHIYDAWIVLPLMVVIIIGWFLAYVYLLTEIGFSASQFIGSCSFSCPSVLAFSFCFIALLCHLFRHPNASKWYRLRKRLDNILKGAGKWIMNSNLSNAS